MTNSISRLQPTKVLENGTETNLPRFDRHLLCNEAGLFPDVLNNWESKVQSVQMNRDGRIGWYRSSSRTSQDSLGIVYDYAGKTEIMHPDFLFFNADAKGKIVADFIALNCAGLLTVSKSMGSNLARSKPSL